jgi:DNA-binding transcriptional LysR family regulator
MYFMWVYEERSFTGASRKAGVVQPTLSVQVRRLEEEFGVELFDRQSRGVVPTAHGKLFYDLCAPIRKGLGLARDKMLEASKEELTVDYIRCGFPPTFYKAIIGPAVADFMGRSPRVELELREGYARTLTDWVLNDKLDFAVGIWTSEIAGLEFEVVFEEEVVLVSGRPIQGPNFSTCDITKVDGLNLMLPSENQTLGPILRHMITSGAIRPARTMVVDSYLGALEIARASDWAALIPVTGLLEEINSPSLFMYKVPQASLQFRWYVVHKEDRPIKAAAHLLIDTIIEELERKKAMWRSIVDQL